MDLINSSVSWVGILVAALASFIFASIWYSPLLFSKPWMRGLGLSEDDIKVKFGSIKSIMFLSYLNLIVTAFALNMFLVIAGADSYYMYAVLSVFAGASFVITTKFNDLLYAYRGPHWGIKAQTLFLIEAGFALCNYFILGSVLYFFM